MRDLIADLFVSLDGYTASEDMGAFFGYPGPGSMPGMKRHPQPASFAWFKENLAAILTQLKAGTSARIALSSLGPIREAPTDRTSTA